MVKKFMLIVVAIVTVLAAGGLAWWALRGEEPDEVTNFYECETAGYAAGESYPRQCFDPNGRNFVEPVSGSQLKDDMLVIHFSKTPESTTEFDYTVPVNREIGETENVFEAALTELIKGPNDSEAETGIFSPIKLSGDSVCNGADFKLTQTMEKLTIGFCREVQSAGIGDDARIKAVINETIYANYPTSVPEVIILDQNGNCFGDLSGQNLCLN